MDPDKIRSPPEAILRAGITSTLQYCEMSFKAQQGLIVYDFSKRQMVDWPVDLCDPEYSRLVTGTFFKNACNFDITLTSSHLQELTDLTIICKKYTKAYSRRTM
jgi:hypothetical protein